MKKVSYIILGVVALLLAAVLHFALPQVDVVRAISAEIKRVDAPDSASGTERTTDVYFLQTETLDGDPSVYRNEDNIFYAKWDSADLQTKVQSLAAEKTVIAVRHYGWRIRFLSTFPNAISVWQVDEDYRHIPVFNIIVIVLFLAGFFLIFRKIRNVRARIATRNAERAAEREARAEAARQASRQTGGREALDDFLDDGKGGGRNGG